MDTNANKILSFEDFSSNNATANATATTEKPTDTVDSTELHDDSKEVENTEDVEESQEETVSKEEPKTVAEMYESMKETVESEAKTYESDEYDEHTIESYIKENAAMNAKMLCSALESCKSIDESYTKEAYEAACSEIKESYIKKVDEMCDAYGNEDQHIKKPTVGGEGSPEPEGAVITQPLK
tara:strand:+ start:2153 stop:2701 length:549 start_codon:yes stop_codon:yes gene_type:complete